MNKYFEEKMERVKQNKNKRKVEVKATLEAHDYTEFEEVTTEKIPVVTKEEE